MKKNVGSYDAAVRFVLGCGMFATVNHHLGWWGLAGVIPILTAAIGFCPAYRIFHVDTTACDSYNAP